MEVKEYYKGVSSIDGMVNRRPSGLNKAQVMEAIDLGMAGDIISTTAPLQVTRAVWKLARKLAGEEYKKRESLIVEAEEMIERRDAKINDLATDLSFHKRELRATRLRVEGLLVYLKSMKKMAKRRLWLAVIATTALCGVAYWDDIYGYLALIYRMVTQ